MALSNSELALKIADVVTGHQAFVTQQLAWLTSEVETVLLSDPYTPSVQVSVKTPWQLQQEYGALLDPVSGQLAVITALQDETAANASAAATSATTASGFASQASTYATTAQTAQAAAASSATSASGSAATAATSATNSNTSAANAAGSASAASASASAAAADATTAGTHATAAEASRLAAEEAAADAIAAADGYDPSNVAITGGTISGITSLETAGAATIGGDIIGSALNLILRRNTSDGSDTGASFLCGGGAASVSRGGVISVYGNEHANAGGVHINAGAAGGTVKLQLDGSTKIEATSSGASVTGTLSVTTLSATGNCTLGDGVDDNVTLSARLIGGIGARAGIGTLDWDDTSNSRSGSGYSLLRSFDAANAPPAPQNTSYYHPFNFEYATKDGSGQITQLAIPYSADIADNNYHDGLYIRGRYAGAWSDWRRIPMCDTAGSLKVAGLTSTVDSTIGSGTFGGWTSVDDLRVLNSSNAGIAIQSGATSLGRVAFGDTALAGYIEYSHTNDVLSIVRMGGASIALGSVATVTGSLIATNGVSITGGTLSIPQGQITSDSYTPSYSNDVGVTATHSNAHYTRVGNTMTVKVSFTYIAGALETSPGNFNASLPVAFTGTPYLAGTATRQPVGGGAIETVRVIQNGTGARAQFASSGTPSEEYSVIAEFTYKIT